MGSILEIFRPLVVPGIAFVATMVLLRFALRGRRVDAHPICRGCGYDLFNLPATSKVCPECGRDLSKKKAVRVGNRTRSRGVVPGAAVIGAWATTWFGLAVWDVARTTDCVSTWPTLVLMRSARGTPGEIRDRAVEELFRRVAAKRLSKDQVRDLVKATTTFSMRARPRVRVGEGIPFRVTATPRPNVPSGGFEISLVEARVGEAAAFRPEGVNLSVWNQGAWRDGVIADPALGVGNHRVRCRFAIGLKGGFPLRAGGWLPLGDAATTIELETPLEIVPAAVETVRLATPEEHRKKVEEGFGVATIRVERMVVTNGEAVRRMARVGLTTAGVPVAVGGRVIIRTKDREIPVMPVMVTPYGWHHFAAVADVGEGRLPEAVEVVIRPETTMARRTVDVHEIWGEEVVIGEVAVKEE